MGIASWPSAQAGYTVRGDGTTQPSIAITLMLRLDEYAISPSRPADVVVRQAAADRDAYARVEEELAKPGVGFALRTTLEQRPGAQPVEHALDTTAFRGFAAAARAALNALCAAETPAIDGGAPLHPAPVSTHIPVTVAPFFASPIVPLVVAILETHGDADVEELRCAPRDETNAFAALATAVERALPGVRVAVGECFDGDDEPAPAAPWLVNVGGTAYGACIAFAPEVRSFAVPPLSTSLASGTVSVASYASGHGLTTSTQLQQLSGDLDAWGAAFLEAVDLALATADGMPAGIVSPQNIATIAAAKRSLVDAIANRVQDVLCDGEPPARAPAQARRAGATAAMKRALQSALSNADAVGAVVQTAVEIARPPEAAARASLSTAATVLVTPPADRRNASGTTAFIAVEVEPGPVMPGAARRTHAVRLAFVRAVPIATATFAGAALPIPLRAYPASPALVEWTASAAVTPAADAAECVRWDATATWLEDDAAQDETVLRFTLETGSEPPHETPYATAAGAVFAALAQFVFTSHDVRADLDPRATDAPSASADARRAGAFSAFAVMAQAVAAAWPSDTVAPHAQSPSASAQPAAADDAGGAVSDFVPGTYTYTLRRDRDERTGQLTVTLTAADSNPSSASPSLAAGTEPGALRALVQSSSTPPRACYTSTGSFRAESPSFYAATLRDLDVVTIAQATFGASVVRNASLVNGATTCADFVYRTPETRFAAPVVPRLVADDVTIGSGPMAQLDGALLAFLQTLVLRGTASQASARTLRIAVSYAESLGGGLETVTPVGLVSAVAVVVNGDAGASVERLATNVVSMVRTWDEQTQPSHADASVLFDVSLSSDGARTDGEPLLAIHAARFRLTDGSPAGG